MLRSHSAHWRKRVKLCLTASRSVLCCAMRRCVCFAVKWNMRRERSKYTGEKKNMHEMHIYSFDRYVVCVPFVWRHLCRTLCHQPIRKQIELNVWNCWSNSGADGWVVVAAWTDTAHDYYYHIVLFPFVMRIVHLYMYGDCRRHRRSMYSTTAVHAILRKQSRANTSYNRPIKIEWRQVETHSTCNWYMDIANDDATHDRDHRIECAHE